MSTQRRSHTYGVVAVITGSLLIFISLTFWTNWFSFENIPEILDDRGFALLFGDPLVFACTLLLSAPLFLFPGLLSLVYHLRHKTHVTKSHAIPALAHTLTILGVILFVLAFYWLLTLQNNKIEGKELAIMPFLWSATLLSSGIYLKISHTEQRP